MSRRKAAPKRKILPDPKYGNLKLAKFMNQIMKNGKKSIAEGIVYGALSEIESKSKKEPVEVFEKALEEVGPVVEVKARRVGGATYQIPLEVRSSRRQALAMRWLVSSARSRSEKTMTSKTILMPLLNSGFKKARKAEPIPPAAPEPGTSETSFFIVLVKISE